MQLFPTEWDDTEYKKLVESLKHQASPKYKAFNDKIIVDDNTIGVPVPILRKYAAQIVRGNWQQFLQLCQNDFHELILLKGFIIGAAKLTFKDTQNLLEGFFPTVRNWCQCDCVIASLKVVNETPEEYFSYAKALLCRTNPWEVRCGLLLMLDFFIEESYLNEIFLRVDTLKRKEYYIEMAVAWLLSICYVHYPEKTFSFLSHNHLSEFALRKTVQKIRESRRVNNEQRKELKDLLEKYFPPKK